MRHGVSRQGQGLQFAVWAPRTDGLELRVGDRQLALDSAPNGWWTAELPSLAPGTPYALVCPGGRRARAVDAVRPGGLPVDRPAVGGPSPGGVRVLRAPCGHLHRGRNARRRGRSAAGAG